MDSNGEALLFLLTIPVWILVANLYGIYGRDEQRTDHSTVDDVVGVFHLVTIGSWIFFAGTWLTGVADPDLAKVAVFWLLAIVLVTGLRAAARACCRRSTSYVQRAIIVGAGDVGQLIGRKLQQHPEYGIELLGFVDSRPKDRRPDLDRFSILGTPDRLAEIVRVQRVDRIVIAFSNESHAETLQLVRSSRNLDVQVDVVPRLFEVLGPEVELHAVEGLPLLGLPPTRPRRLSVAVKRTIDVALAGTLLLLTAPLFAFIAVRIRLDSSGPVFFRQTRLGIRMRRFTALKFRTMAVGTDVAAHREYIRATAAGIPREPENGLFKPDRADVVTPFGRWLRRTSLDELPQLWNVFRGDMSLVGPRPCIPYEVEFFEPHHFERFNVPAGLTGLWQVTARAHATFGEALDMDVTYARAASLGLDLRLLCRTPLQVVRQQRGTA